ncbi:MAG: AmmeMemoRadiSam system protein B [Patescibacteria group bacterium]|nr:AmmeMemoRadiSam system protein B [Patescibacteria group bacterium]
MAYRTPVLASIVAAACIISALVAAAQSNSSATNSTATTHKRDSTEQSVVSPFFFQNSFDNALRDGAAYSHPFPENKIRVGIIPHDLAHAEYAAHFFRNIQKQNPELIIIVGTNHYERGASNAITSSAAWTLPFGTVLADTGIIAHLVDSSGMEDNPEIIRTDHAVASAVPYIEYFLPDVKIVPILLKSGCTSDQIDSIVERLLPNVPADTLVIASVDFSHYLPRSRAEQNDEWTRSNLLSLNDASFLALGAQFNDYVDSPGSVAMALRWAKAVGARNGEIIYNTNSAALAGIENAATTTYFEAIYY